MKSKDKCKNWKDHGVGKHADMYPQFDYAVLTLNIDEQHKPFEHNVIRQFTHMHELPETLHTAGYPGDKWPRYTMWESDFTWTHLEYAHPHEPATKSVEATNKQQQQNAGVVLGKKTTKEKKFLWMTKHVEISNYVAQGQSGSSVYVNNMKLGFPGVAIVSTGDTALHRYHRLCRINKESALDICSLLMIRGGLEHEQKICMELHKTDGDALAQKLEAHKGNYEVEKDDKDEKKQDIVVDKSEIVAKEYENVYTKSESQYYDANLNRYIAGFYASDRYVPVTHNFHGILLILFDKNVLRNKQYVIYADELRNVNHGHDAYAYMSFDYVVLFGIIPLFGIISFAILCCLCVSASFLIGLATKNIQKDEHRFSDQNEENGQNNV